MKELSKRYAGDFYEIAKKEFGTTEDWREAGYILPDGTLLDLSGKNQGGSPGVRSRDHREVGTFTFRGGTAGMREFMQHGAIRVGIGYMDLVKKPTEAQFRRIAEAVIFNGGEMTIDVSKGIGEYNERDDMYFDRNKEAFEYPAGTRPSKVLSSLRKYFG